MAGRKQTFLHKAIISADVDFINVLISTTLEEHGAKDVDELLNLEDVDSNTPLLLAVKRKSLEITKALIDKGPYLYDVHNFVLFFYVPPHFHICYHASQIWE